ncbi:ABC transporter permease [Actinomadura sp. KC06]|uniref:ABC transporter permease n=1 Tax=Actinomadura sp. KC06 TaxID=2530369 RepID=UPI00104BF903|nr:ABC transporter permease [Actinomadura sp. KC06]TDD35286.1 ABC transporter permease [Actinomadura sp. KC06]
MAAATVAAAPPRHHRGGSLRGTATLVRFTLRRDRVRLPVWIAALVLSTVSSVSSFTTTYPSAKERQARAELMDSPTGAALAGPGHGLDGYTYGAMISNEMLLYVAIFAALMSVLLVTRHTRAEEETGCAELVRASVVGRRAPLTATLIVVAGANLLLGALLALGLGSSGVESITWAGSIAFAASVTAAGLVFTGVAAVTAQVTEHARGAAGIAGALLGTAYALRAAGDMSNGALSWLSPIGWAQATRAYVDERWWPLGIAIAVTATLIAVAYRLAARRDLGAGLVRPRPGPATASPLLSTPLGLALRLQRAALLWWSLAMLITGLMYGSLVSSVEDMAADSGTVRDWIQDVPGGSIVDSWLTIIVSVLAMFVSVYAILAAQRAQSEEAAGRAEPVLATGVSRTRWATAHLTVALLGGAFLLLLSALGLGVAAATALDDPGMIPRLLGAALAYVPAMWITAALAIALYGLLPRAIALAWAVLVYALVVGMLGGLFQWPDWMADLSPFGHVPQLPGAEVSALPIVILLAIAAALIAVGLAGFRRRDIAT